MAAARTGSVGQKGWRRLEDLGGLGTMKTWGSWGRVVASIGGVALAGVLLAVMASRHAGQHWLLSASLPSPTMAIKTAGLTQARKNPEWVEAYGKLPLSFEENQGQTSQEVRYVSRGAGYELFLTPQEAVLALRPNVAHDLSPLHRAAFIKAIREARQAGQMAVIRMRLEGANPEPQMTGTDRLPTKVNYFIGNDPKKWRTSVPSYAGVKYADIYPGVDLVFYGNERRLEYDFVVAPGADPKAIALRVEGGGKMRINSRGDLVLSVSGGEVELRKPVVYQNVRGGRREIAGRYAIAENNRINFVVASYDRSEPLIVDPVLNYSTYLGGSSDDIGFAIAVDTAGDAFVAGQTFSTDFPVGTQGAVVPPPTTNSGATFIAELNPAGTQLLYSTYLVGTTTNGGDSAFGIAVDSSGKAYVTGSTFATDFPTTPGSLKPGPLGTNPNGTAFVTKLDPAASGTASLVYSTYLGGTGGEFANGIAADATGNAYVAGITHSVDFPTMNAFQSSPKNAFGTGFLSKIDPTGASLIYSTYLGGAAANEANVNGPGYGEQIFGVTADSSNNAYLVGTTTSTDSSFITTASAYQLAPPTGNKLAAAFLSRIDTTKSANASLIYSTYLAGSAEDLGFAIALGPNNVAYVTGSTNSTDFPSPGATVGAFSATGTTFVTLVDTTKSGNARPGGSVTYSTYLGGSGGESGFGIRADSQGNAYVVGTTASSDFAGAGTLKSLGAFQPALTDTAGNAFVAKLKPAGMGASDLLYATYFGGNGNNGTTTPVPDQGFGIAIDSSNPSNAYITGQTNSADLPILPSPGAFQTKLNGTGAVGFSDAFVAKLTPIPTLAISPASLNFGTQPVGVTSAPQTVTVTNNNNGAVTISSISITGTNSADFSKATDTCSPSVAAGAQCTVSVTFTPSAPPKLNEMATLVFTDNDVNSPQIVSLSGSAPIPAAGLAPTSLAFGNQVVNTTSAGQTETLTNTGTGPLTILSIAASGDFAEISTGASACPVTPATLAAGSNCTISLTFTPTATGARSGTLTITDDASNSPQTVPLSGTGTAPQPDFTLSAAPTSLTVAQGAVGAPVTISVNPTNGFSSAVALTCMGAPTNSSCMLSPASITPPTTSTLTFTAHAMLVPLPISKPAPPLNFLRIVPLFLALMLIFLLRSAQRLRMRLVTVSAIVICITLAACGGSSNKNTAKGTYPLTVTGTSGALSHTTTVTVTVN